MTSRTCQSWNVTNISETMRKMQKAESLKELDRWLVTVQHEGERRQCAFAGGGQVSGPREERVCERNQELGGW